jgi:hypothetical protein
MPRAKKKSSAPAVTLPAPLPEGIEPSDLVRPEYKENKNLGYDRSQFELWYTERFGWVIPTLDISGAGRHATRRTYAISVRSPDTTCSVGHGPHVLATVTVYLRHKTETRLTKFIDLRQRGRGKAGEIRDVRSTRRANGILRRRTFGLEGW